MKHTGSVMVVLLVGLLISCTSTPSIATHACTTVEQYLDLIQPQNPMAKFTTLDTRALAVFRYNYNREPPVSESDITGVVIGARMDTQRLLVAIAIEGCIKLQSGVSHEFLRKMLEEPHEAELPIPSRYNFTDMPISRFNIIV
jgi:ribulose kinase